MKQNLFLTLILSGISVTLAHRARADDSDLLKKAEAAYQEGNCEAAIPLFQQYKLNPGTTTAQRAAAWFKEGYCHLSKGASEKSEKAFEKALETYPNWEEAILRRAEALFQLQRYAECIKLTKKFPDGSSFQKDARLLEARALMDGNEAESALRVLRTLTNAFSGDPQILYWRGVAWYRAGDNARARSTFIETKKMSPQEAWTHSAAQDWIAELERAERKYSLRIEAGWGVDGNLAQSGGYLETSLLSTPSTNLFGSTADYAKDHVYLASVSLTRHLYKSQTSGWDLAVDASATFHTSETGQPYDLEFTTLRTGYQNSPKPNWGWNVDLAFQDLRYRYLYFQDYGVISPGAWVSLGSSASLSLQAPITVNLLTRPALSYAPALTYNLRTGWGSIFVGGIFTRSQGQAAVISTQTTPFTVTSGDLFSRSSSYALRTGMSLNLPWKLEFGIQAMASLTQYDAEALSSASSGGKSSSNTGTNAPRRDLLGLGSASLTAPLFDPSLRVTLSGTYTVNSSSGFQGLDYYGYTANLTYTRPYLSLSLAYTY